MSAPSAIRASSSSTPGAPFDPRHEEARLLERGERLVGLALARGADEAEAFVSYVRTTAVRFEKGDLKLVQVDEGASAGLRVFSAERLGFASTNQEDEGSLAAAAADARALSLHAPPHTANHLPDARPIVRNANLVERELADLPVERAVDLGLEILTRVKRRDPRLSIDGANCELSCVSQALRTSRGIAVSESDALVSLSVAGMAIDGEDVGGFHYGGVLVRREREIEAELARLVDEFCEVALGNLAVARAESYRGPVLFSPAAFLSLFVSPLVLASSAIAVQRQRSALAGKLGQVIGTPDLSIHDDPTDEHLAGASTFDREGQPVTRFALVERGVLASYLYNAYAARVESRLSTGHAVGGVRSVPGLGPHAITVAAGAGGTRADLARSLGRGLYVERFSGTVDPASGDFSGVAKSARWIEGGAFVRPVGETLLAGNVFALLQRITALGSRSEIVSGSARAPYAIVDGLSVTAG